MRSMIAIKGIWVAFIEVWYSDFYRTIQDEAQVIVIAIAAKKRKHQAASDKAHMSDDHSIDRVRARLGADISVLMGSCDVAANFRRGRLGVTSSHQYQNARRRAGSNIGRLSVNG